MDSSPLVTWESWTQLLLVVATLHLALAFPSFSCILAFRSLKIWYHNFLRYPPGRRFINHDISRGVAPSISILFLMSYCTKMQRIAFLSNLLYRWSDTQHSIHGCRLYSDLLWAWCFIASEIVRWTLTSTVIGGWSHVSQPTCTLPRIVLARSWHVTYFDKSLPSVDSSSLQQHSANVCLDKSVAIKFYVLPSKQRTLLGVYSLSLSVRRQ